MARSPSSSPASASTKAPTQTDAIRVPASAARRSASRTRSEGGPDSSERPGTMIVSAVSSASRPRSIRRARPSVRTSGDGAHSVTR
ncbi:hypothetical protein RKD37_000841 [Streptomyces ambofaciens]